MSTSYTAEKLVGAEFVAIEDSTKSRKGATLAIATEVRNTEKVAVRVVTQSGQVVEELAAPRVVASGASRSKPFTRLEGTPLELAEGVTLPEGYEVAYQRARITALVLRKGKGDYLVFNTQTGQSIPATGTKDAREKTNALKAGTLGWDGAEVAAA